jgi:tetratricopeptide (TPR) repeat protein
MIECAAMRIRGAIAALAALLLAGSAAPSLAQPRPSKPPAAAASPGKEDPAALARSRFKEGVAFAKKKDWQKAYGAFLEAWKRKEHPQIALNLGRAEIETGKYRDAIAHLRYCTANMEAADPDLGLARDWLAEAEQKAAKLVITVDAPGAEVLVDGAPEGKAPLAGPVLVDPGNHLVEVKSGERQAERRVDVQLGDSLAVDLRLPPATAATAPRPDTPPPSGPSPLRTIVLAGGATGTLIGLAIGATFAGLAFEKQAARDACTRQTDRSCWAPLEADRATFARGSLGGFIGAGLFAAGTAAFLIFGPKQPKMVVAPAASPQGAGLFAAGQF